MEYPKWIDDIFLLFLSNYDRLWLDTIPDKRTEHMKRLNWIEALQNFKPETIMRAAKQARLNSPIFPPRIGEIYLLCDEFSKTNRYVEVQLEHQSPDFVDGKRVVSEVAQKALDEIWKTWGRKKNEPS